MNLTSPEVYYPSNKKSRQDIQDHLDILQRLYDAGKLK